MNIKSETVKRHTEDTLNFIKQSFAEMGLDMPGELEKIMRLGFNAYVETMDRLNGIAGEGMNFYEMVGLAAALEQAANMVKGQINSMIKYDKTQYEVDIMRKWITMLFSQSTRMVTINVDEIKKNN